MITSKIQSRLNEVCPVYHISDKSRETVYTDCRVAFSIIGFISDNFDECFDKQWSNHMDMYLSDFVYDLWRCCKE